MFDAWRKNCGEGSLLFPVVLVPKDCLSHVISEEQARDLTQKQRVILLDPVA